MPTSATDKARDVSFQQKDEMENVDIILYIGVFFDGTNNNMSQAMVGQYSRRKSLYKKHKKELEARGVESLSAMLAHDRGYWETGDGKGVFNRSDLDKIYGLGKTAKADIDKQAAEYGARSFAGDNQKKYDKAYDKLSKMVDISDSDTSWFQDISLYSMGNGSTYTNPAILSSLYKKCEEEKDGKKIIREPLYIEGSGTDTNLYIWKHDYVGDILGLGFGVGSTGISEKCRRMAQRVKTLVEKYSVPQDGTIPKISLHFQIFGFSRGSTTARLFTYLINPKGNYTISKNDLKLFTGSDNPFLPLREKDSKSAIVKKTIDFLGIYDTVSSVGILRDALNLKLSDVLKLKEKNEEFSVYKKSLYHDDNVRDFYLNHTSEAKKTLHICALDENRANFALVDIEDSLNSSGTEILMPGCHTDIGGGASFGLDALKIINKSKITNMDEIIHQVEGAVEVAKGIQDTLSSSFEIANNVKEVLKGVEMMKTGMVASGTTKVVDESISTYESVKDTVHKANVTAHQLRDLLCQSYNEVNRNTNPSIISAIKSEVESGSNPFDNLSAIGKAIVNNGTEAMEGVTGIIGAVKESIGDTGQIVSTSAAVGRMLLPAGSPFADTALTLDAIDALSDSIGDVASEIKNTGRGLMETLKRKVRDLLPIQTISDGIKDMANDIKSVASEAKDTVGCIYDIVKDKDKRLLDIKKSRLYMYDDIPACYNSSELVYKAVGEEALKALGWVPESTKAIEGSPRSGRATPKLLESAQNTILLKNTKAITKTDLENIGLYKYSFPGYSNVTLKVMYDRAQNDGNVLFETYPTDNYGVPSDLNNLYSIVRDAAAVSNGRYICVPKYNQYRLLRCKYLHFSSNQQLVSPADNLLVNPPSVSDKMSPDKLVIMRRVYKGNGDKSEKYLYDYSSNAEVKEVELEINGKELIIKD